MRTGRVFRRCGKCNRAIATGERACACGSRSSSWAFTVDLNPPGSKPRRQKMRAGFRTAEEAREAITRLQVDRADGAYVEPSKLTTGAYLERWVVEARGAGGIRATTAKTYDVAVRRHINPRVGSIPLQQLTRGQIKSMYDRLRSEPNAKDGGQLAARSVFNIHLALHRALDAAVDEGLIKSNPADRTCSAPADKPGIRYWSAPELRTFLASVADDEKAVLWRLAAATGMRRGELLGLRWRDIDLSRRRLAVVQQLVHARPEKFGEPKTAAGKRSIPLDVVTLAVLEGLHSAQAKNVIALGEAYRRDLDLVFCRVDGSPLDPAVVSHQFARLASRARVPVIRFHDNRHTCATLMFAAGYHPKDVQERLGHSSVKVTMDTYSGVIPARQEQAANWISDVVDAAPRAL